MTYQWLLFCPQLPATPSSPRVTIWRKMRAAGAVGLDNGLWILLHTDAAEKMAQDMKAYVAAQGGSSKTFLSQSFDEATEQEILERFRRDRAEEYAELKEQCLDFLAEIEKETARQNFSFAEYEENEQDLVKLDAWYEKVRQRDFLGGEQALEATDWLEKCRQALQQFATLVFQHEKVLFDDALLKEAALDDESAPTDKTAPSDKAALSDEKRAHPLPAKAEDEIRGDEIDTVSKGKRV